MSVINKRPQRSAFEESIERGVFIVKKLATLNFDSLLRKVKKVARQHDKGEWYKAATRLGIDVEALHILDSASPPIPYPFYFCTPDILRMHPELIMYYRNVAMMSQKAMNDMGLSTVGYEAGFPPPPDIAQDLTHHFNQIISALVKAGQVTPQRHLEMAYSNLGDSLGGDWRNEERMDAIPTLKEILEGYKRFNTWESEEQKRELPELSVEESLTQFFELCDLARALTPNIEQLFLEQDEAHWITLREKLQRAARTMGNASTT